MPELAAGADRGRQSRRRRRLARQAGRQAGRQLTRVGALGQRMRRPAIAELAYAAAIRLHPDPAWCVRLGQIREARDRWDAAAAAYTRAVTAAAARAVAAASPDQQRHLAHAHYRLARLWVRRADWASATTSFAEAVRLAPDRPQWRTELAAAYETVGDWPAAADLRRRLLSHRPTDHTLRTRLVDCLEQHYLVPFALDHCGGVTATAATSRDAALAEAIDHLRHLTEQDPARAGPPHRLGLLYERSDQPEPAAAAYQRALARLAAVDAWWCHRAAHEWAFRLAYVRQRLARSAAPDPRLVRSAGPAGTDTVTEPAGFFDAVVFRHGLQLSGFLRPGATGLVDICLDDRVLTQVRVAATGWRPAVRYDVGHGLLAEFPERSLLRLRAGEQPLVTRGGAAALELVVPGGSGEVAGKLASGRRPTKKGGWPPAGAALAARQQAYLEVYGRARTLLDAQDRRLFLCYGTLLGCQREGDFIPGDDDFDVSYPSHAADPAAFRDECWQVALALLRQGLDVNLSINGRMFKVGLDGVWIDITPMWFYRGRAWAFDAHNLTPAAFEPVRVGAFRGQQVYLPHDPEEFLADTYGPDWRTPQPDFRYYRSKADDRVLSQMWATPSEVRTFARLAGAERARNPAAGRFVGVGHPGYPGFSWLTAPGQQPTAGPSGVA